LHEVEDTHARLRVEFGNAAKVVERQVE
jgi:hypothetical protein